MFKNAKPLENHTCGFRNLVLRRKVWNICSNKSWKLTLFSTFLHTVFSSRNTSQYFKILCHWITVIKWFSAHQFWHPFFGQKVLFRPFWALFLHHGQKIIFHFIKITNYTDLRQQANLCLENHVYQWRVMYSFSLTVLV